MFTKYLATAMLGTALISGAAVAQSVAPSPSAGSGASINAASNLNGTWRASKLVGLSVYNQSNERLGDINEILVDNTGKINAVIVGVGGFLGVGEQNVAVSFDQIKWVNEPVRTASTTDKTAVTPGVSPSPSTTTTGSSTGVANAGRDTRDNWYPDHAVINGTKEQLKALPPFKFSDYNK